ncbi:MAG: TIGR03032 family protein [Myxococcales bacterium]|nr:TIGR03032 family protein [Myxococcales bacterium]
MSPEPAPPVSILSSRQLPGWLDEVGASLALTTYQAGKLFLIGRQEGGRLSLFERTFNRCMGLWAGGGELWMSSLFQLWRFADALAPGATHQGYDRVYVPQVAYTTGDLDVHDVAVMADGRPCFVNTLFSCLATVSERASFAPLWRPPWISRLAAEDRCHLNGLALEDGAPAYASAVARTDVADGWRDHRRRGGVVVRIADGEVVAEGLSMPHSPRLHRGELWLLEAGSGYLGVVDRARGTFERRVFCPGYARGLAFVDRYALVGVSALRGERTFADLELGEELARRGAVARCALLVVDLERGDVVHWLRFDGAIQELYDVAVLPGARRPMAIGLRSDEIRRVITIGDAATLPASGPTRPSPRGA